MITGVTLRLEELVGADSLPKSTIFGGKICVSGGKLWPTSHFRQNENVHIVFDDSLEPFFS